MTDREAIAHRYGFASYAALRAVSEPLPMSKGDVMQAYVARHGNGHWFVWEAPPEKSGDGDVDAKPIA